MYVAPACVPKLSQPSASGGVVTASTTRGRSRRATRSRPWKSTASSSTRTPAARAMRSIGPKNALSTRTCGFCRKA